MMDRELIAYFDERFRETSQNCADLRQDIATLLQKIDVLFGQEVGALRQELGTLRQEVGRLRRTVNILEDGIAQSYGVDEAIRHTCAAVKGVHDEACLVAEGAIAVNDRLDGFGAAAVLKLEELKISMIPYCRSLDLLTHALEEREVRRDLVVHELILEKFGKPRAQ